MKRSFLRVNRTYIVVAAMFLLLPLFLSDFRLNLMGKFLSFAIAAVGIDLVWGYTGVLSLGQGVFFSLGAYGMAMYLKLTCGELPDFMMWSGLSDVPWFWRPFKHFWFAFPMALLIPMALAFIIGSFTFRARVRGVYFTILTQALALVFSILFIGQQPYTGGTNGITNFQDIFGFSLSRSSTMCGLYVASVLVLLFIFMLSKWLVQTRAGRILVATRDGEDRLRFLGYAPAAFKTGVFVLSAGMAGLAGVLYVPQVGIISPSMMGILPSVEMAMWVAVGGRGTLSGAVMGAIAVNFAKSYLSESFPDVWLYFLGGLFVGVVLVFPNGMSGMIERLQTLALRGLTGPGFLHLFHGTLGRRRFKITGRTRTDSVEAGFGPWFEGQQNCPRPPFTKGEL